MAEPKRVEVELSEYLSSLEPVAIKKLVSAPIAYRADRLIEAIPRRYGTVGHGELISALLHGTTPDSGTLATLIENYREDRVFDTRTSLGETTPKSGSWLIELRGSGQRTPQ
jgi:hypothetical protein